MSHKHARFERMAQRLIKKNGEGAVIVALGETSNEAVDTWSEYFDNPISSERDPIRMTPAEHPCRAVADDLTEEERRDSAISTTQAAYLVSTEGLSITPQVDQQFAFAGGPARPIKAVNSEEPAGVALVYRIRVLK